MNENKELFKKHFESINVSVFANNFSALHGTIATLPDLGLSGSNKRLIDLFHRISNFG